MRTELPHSGQIITTKRTINDFISDIEMPVTINTVYLLAGGTCTEEDKIRLFSICARLYYLSKLIYKGTEGNSKLNAEEYRKQLFDVHGETVEEIVSILEQKRFDRDGKNVTPASPTQVYHQLCVLEQLWCRGISCLSEQIYIPELAYEFEYVFNHGADIPCPEFAGTDIFPNNYSDFDYDKGIAKEFGNLMLSIL